MPTDYTAPSRRWLVVYTTPPSWHVLDAGQVLSTSHEVGVHDDRAAALADYTARGGDPEAVPEDPPLPERPRLTKLAYSLRFTLEERIAIRSSEDPIVQDSQHLLALAEYVDVTDPVTVQGVEYLESVGLIAPGRAAEILDPEAP